MNSLLVALLITAQTSQTVATSTNTVPRKLFDELAKEAIDAQTQREKYKLKYETCWEKEQIRLQTDAQEESNQKIQDAAEDYKEAKEASGKVDLLWIAVAGGAGLVVGALLGVVLGAKSGGVVVVGGGQ